MRKFNFILAQNLFARFIRILFAFQFGMFTLLSIFSTDSESKTKALTNAAYTGVCFLIQDSLFKKEYRWMKGDE